MLAQRRRRWPNIISQLGQCIVLYGWWPFGNKVSPAWQSQRTPDSVSMLSQRRRLRVNNETALGECHVFDNVQAQSIQQTQCWIKLVLGQRRRRLAGIEPAMAQH